MSYKINKIYIKNSRKSMNNDYNYHLADKIIIELYINLNGKKFFLVKQCDES